MDYDDFDYEPDYDEGYDYYPWSSYDCPPVTLRGVLRKWIKAIVFWARYRSHFWNNGDVPV